MGEEEVLDRAVFGVGGGPYGGLHLIAVVVALLFGGDQACAGGD